MATVIEKVGGEFLVNTGIADDQHDPTIAALSGGGFVANWIDESGPGSTIKSQLFDAVGAKVGDEIVVSAQTPDTQGEPTAAALRGGGFVSIWVDSSGAGLDTSSMGVMAQVIDAAGNKVGGKFLVNTETASAQNNPTITALPDGGFVVGWVDLSGVGGDASGQGIKVQRFDAAGTKVGIEVLVNTETLSTQHQPTIATLRDGGFVVSWTDYSGVGVDKSVAGIKAQMFDVAGVKVGGEVLVNTETASTQFQPTIAALPDGGFVVGWTDLSGVGSDASGAGIKMQRFDAAGTKVGIELLINTETANGQEEPIITALSNGGFVVGWADYSGAGPDASGAGIKAQVFDADGIRIGGEFLVNTGTADTQFQPTITALPGGKFVVGWTDFSGVAPDTDGTGFKAQVFQIVERSAPVATDVQKAGLEDTAIAGQLAATDAESDPLTYSIVRGAQDANGRALTGLTLDADGGYAFLGPQDFHGTVSFTYTASDGVLVSDAATATLVVTPVSDAPVAPALADHVHFEDRAVSFQVPVFADGDGDALDYTATLASGAALPDWLDFDAASRTFSGTPPANFHGALDVRVTASDGLASTSASDTFWLAVMPVNDAPVAPTLSDRAVLEDRALSFRVRAFADLDGDALSYTATLASGQPLPAWLGFDVAARTFSGTPPVSLDGAIDIKVTARDGAASASDIFRLTLKEAGLPDREIVGTSRSETIRGGERVHDTIRALGGDDVVLGQSGRDHLRGDSGHDRLHGGGGSDQIHGGSGHDRLFGAGGADLLRGNDGHDRLFGGGGADRLHGGYGRDVLTGGTGADVFVFSPRPDTADGAVTDRITDFRLGVDDIDLTGGVRVVAMTTSHLDAARPGEAHRLDTTLVLSDGARVEVMNTSGLAMSEWVLLA